MPKVLLLLLSLIVATSLLTSPAHAASKRYSISAENRSYEYINGKYRYLSKSVIDVSNNHRRDYVLVTGRVKGGPVKRKSVKIYATNTNDPKYRKNTYLGKARLSAKGKFSKKIRPPRGGRWKYTITMPASGRYKSKSRTTTMDAFHWTHLDELTNISRVPGVTVQTGDAREYVSGTRWGSQFAIDGGSSVTFRTKAYRCKKLSLKTGVSEQTPDQATWGRIEFVQNSRVRTGLTMNRTQEHFDAAGNDAAARTFRDSITASHDLTMRVPATIASEDDEQAETPQVRFIVGNPKAFCTFPSTNKDL